MGYMINVCRPARLPPLKGLATTSFLTMDIPSHHQIEKKEKKIDPSDARNRTHDQNFTQRSQHHKIEKNEEKTSFSTKLEKKKKFTLPTPGIEPTTKISPSVPDTTKKKKMKKKPFFRSIQFRESNPRPNTLKRTPK